MSLCGQQGTDGGVGTRIDEDMYFLSVAHWRTAMPAVAAVFDGPEVASLLREW